MYKIALAGPSGSGKSAFVHRIRGTYREGSPHIRTIGVSVHPITLRTSEGELEISLWDCAGDDRFGGSRGGYLMKADGGIIFGGSSFKYVQRLREYSPTAPLICAMLGDSETRVMEDIIRKAIGREINVYEVLYGYSNPLDIESLSAEECRAILSEQATA